MGHLQTCSNSPAPPYFGAHNILRFFLASFIQRIKKGENLNRNTETLAWHIPTAFVSEERRSARTETTTAAQKVLQQQACSFQCPRLALTPKQLLYAPQQLFCEYRSGVVQPASSLGSMKRRGGREDKNQGRPKDSQRSTTTVLVLVPLSGS